MVARIFCALLISTLFGPARWGSAAVVHHDLRVQLNPQARGFIVQDTVTLPLERPEAVIFSLLAGLAPRSPDAVIEPIAPQGPAQSYQVHLPPGRNRFVLHYGGHLLQAPESGGKEYTSWMQPMQGQIGPEGVYLSAESLWYPQFDDEWVTFCLRIEMPAAWQAVSQGRRDVQKPGEVTWTVDAPQEQIFLVAGPLTAYLGPAGRVQAMVFLRRPEAALAKTYLDATARIVSMYERLIGPYPYSKFALVENYRETGLGLPSFTLMGSKVIHFPFILYSSYPHEILHNWWGNSVYPRYATGNWAEGLTACLADLLFQEQRGRGAQYRQTVLQKYTDFVSSEKDFPLTEFTARHDPASEAVGYGKGMMFFHMLRRRLGDAAFISALRSFYETYRFRTAGFDDLQHAFEKAAGKPLETMFAQWIRRTGAPQLAVEGASVRAVGGSYLLEATLRQRQPGWPYSLSVPVAVTLAGAPAARVVVVPMRGRAQKLTQAFNRRPLRLDVDPCYDIFRRLARTEIPPALSQVFGADRLTVVLPANAPPERQTAYQMFAEDLRRAGPTNVAVVLDRDIDRLPGQSLVLLGWENRFFPAVAKQAARYGTVMMAQQLTLDQKSISRPGHSVALTLRHPDDDRAVLAWIAADPSAALPGLARKLPHYSKYSYLVFSGDQPENIAKGRWPVLDSPMTVFFTHERSAIGRLPEEVPLVRASANR
jgi:Peptidase family M1 domain